MQGIDARVANPKTKGKKLVAILETCNLQEIMLCLCSVEVSPLCVLPHLCRTEAVSQGSSETGKGQLHYDDAVLCVHSTSQQQVITQYGIS